MKTALITGASKRIGRAIALDLARHGYALALHYHNSQLEAEQLASEIAALGQKAICLKADLCETKQTLALVNKAQEALNLPIDILINNASLFEPDDIKTVSDDLLYRHFDIHVKAPALLAQAMAKALPQDHNGLIINMIDQRIWALKPTFFSYTLSKSALWTMTQTLAQALAPTIRVNAIAPGATLPSKRQSQDDFDRQSKTTPLKNGAKLEEITATIRYIIETKSMTGQMIVLDGGQHLAWQTPDFTGITE